MPMNEKLTVELSKSQAGALRRAVASSGYVDTDEIMAEALSDWFAKRDAMASDIELLRRLTSGSSAIMGEIHPVNFTGLRKVQQQQRKSA
jgi:Arc/MetJ-type ribon-helix-helix transcriptional regulator